MSAVVVTRQHPRQYPSRRTVPVGARADCDVMAILHMESAGTLRSFASEQNTYPLYGWLPDPILSHMVCAFNARKKTEK